MPLGDIKFTKGQGGLGRTLPGKDHYSGLVFYSDEKPANWPVNGIKLINSIEDAEDAGIKSDSSDDQIKVMHYHLSRFFDIYTQLNVKAKLWLMIADEPTGAYDYAEITSVVDASNGDIRLVGLFLEEEFASAQVTAIQTVINSLDNHHKPISVLLNADFKSVVDLSSLANLRDLTANKVSVSIGQDGGAKGAELYGIYGKSVGNIGSILGWASIKNVSWNIGWPEKFNVVVDSEYDIPAFANGQLVKDKLSMVDEIHEKGYILLIKRVGSSGTYFNDSHTCIDITSDYAYLENNQVIDKAIRLVYDALSPNINSPIRIDAETGKIDILTVSHFENLASQKLSEMTKADELSGFTVYIDPDQDVLGTSKLKVTITLVINGVARDIDVSISFVKSVN